MEGEAAPREPRPVPEQDCRIPDFAYVAACAAVAGEYSVPDALECPGAGRGCAESISGSSKQRCSQEVLKKSESGDSGVRGIRRRAVIVSNRQRGEREPALSEVE